MTIGEFIVKLGFKAETTKVKDFTKAIGEIPLGVAAAIGALAGIDFSLMMMTKSALNAAQGFTLFTQTTGLSSKELQKWQIVAKGIGLDENTVTSSVRGLQNTLAQIRLGHGELLMGFGKLGVDVRGKNPFQILEALRGRVGKYDPGVAAQLLSSIGVSPDMLSLLRMPRGKFESMYDASGGGMTEKQMKAFSQLKTLLTELGENIERDFYPALEKAVPLFKEFVQSLTVVIRDLEPFVGKISKGVLKTLTADAQSVDSLMWQFNKAYPDRGPNVTPAGAPNGTRMGGGLNLSQYIYSTASPEEVAQHSISEMKRHTTRAAKQFGNTGY